MVRIRETSRGWRRGAVDPLDLTDPDATATMMRLLARADVFVQNLAPGAATRLGLDPTRLRARFPRPVTCSTNPS